MTGALQAIIFDFDGVIVDSERVHLRAYQETLAPLGLSLSSDTYYSDYLGYDDVQVMRVYARNNRLSWSEDKIAQLVETKVRRYEELTANGAMLFPGAGEFVRQASAAVPIAIASGALTHEIEDALDRTGLRQLFSAVVGADQTVRSKPSPDPYLEAFAQLSRKSDRRIEPAQTVAIEDSRWGLESAGSAGLRLVAVTNTYTASELSSHAELVVSGLDTLTLAALDTLCASSSTLAGQGNKS